MNYQTLFTPVVPDDKLHPNFSNIRKVWGPSEQEVINHWLTGFVDRDNKFITEFQTTFNSSFWELYIFNCLKRFNLDFDFSHQSPDFICSNAGCNFAAIFECTIGSHGKDQNAEWEKKFTKEEIEKSPEIMIHQATIRACNAITSKYKKYMDSYQHLAHVKGKPFFICLGMYDQPYFYSVPTFMMDRVLFAADRLCNLFSVNYLFRCK